MAARNLIVLLALLCALVCPARGDDGGVKPGRWKIKGMAFGTGHDLESIHEPYAQKSLNLLKTTNINYIHVSAYGKMKTKWSLTYKMETDDDSIRFQIRMHKRNGLKVLFKPVLEIKNDVWRGFIPNRHKFMYATYGPFISKMARIAEEEKVDLFAVGSEYKQTLPNRIAWRWVIRRVRSIYKGRVTYVANHDVRNRCAAPRLPSATNVCCAIVDIPSVQILGPGGFDIGLGLFPAGASRGRHLRCVAQPARNANVMGEESGKA